MQNQRAAILPPVIFFCQIFRVHVPNVLSTTTEREGKHEQETDNNTRNSRNVRIGFRTSWAWRTPSSSRTAPSSPPCSAPSSSPSSLRLGYRCGGNRNRRHRTRYRSPCACRCVACACCGFSGARGSAPATGSCRSAGCHI